MSNREQNEGKISADVRVCVYESQRSAASVFDERLFAEEFHAAMGHIEVVAQDGINCERPPPAMQMRPPGQIAVFGRRRAGKSSFLKALIEHCGPSHSQSEATGRNASAGVASETKRLPRIHPLGPFDPNRTERHVSFLATVDSQEGARIAAARRLSVGDGDTPAKGWSALAVNRRPTEARSVPPVVERDDLERGATSTARADRHGRKVFAT